MIVYCLSYFTSTRVLHMLCWCWCVYFVDLCLSHVYYSLSCFLRMLILFPPALLQRFHEALVYQHSNKSTKELAKWFHNKISKSKLDWGKQARAQWTNLMANLNDPEQTDLKSTDLKYFSEKHQQAAVQSSIDERCAEEKEQGNVAALCRSGNAATQPSTPQSGGGAQPCCMQ